VGSDLRGLVADRAVDGAELVVHPDHRAQVDQLEPPVVLDDVVGFEVAVGESLRMQVTQRGQHLHHVRDRLGDRQGFNVPVWPAPGLQQLLER
jgi:hypothetical protein